MGQELIERGVIRTRCLKRAFRARAAFVGMDRYDFRELHVSGMNRS